MGNVLYHAVLKTYEVELRTREVLLNPSWEIGYTRTLLKMLYVMLCVMTTPLGSTVLPGVKISYSICAGRTSLDLTKVGAAQSGPYQLP